MASGDPGGGAQALLDLLPALKSIGIDCTIVTSSRGVLAKRLEHSNFKVICLEMMGKRGDIRISMALRAIELKERPDLIHVHGTRAGFIHTSGLNRTPTVYTAHGLSYRQHGGIAHKGIRMITEYLICRNASEVVTVSNADLVDLRRRKFIPSTKGVHIPNAVDLGRFHPRDSSEARHLLGIQKNCLVVGTVARLVAGKGVVDLVDAVSELPGTLLVVVGDGPEKSFLEEYASKSRVRALFMGSRNDVELILPAFDIFVLPSLWEGEPIALLEAMAARVPSISTATTGGREALGKDRGILVPLHNTSLMAKAIHALASDSELQNRLTNSAFKHVSLRTWERAAASYVGVYQHVLARAC